MRRWQLVLIFGLCAILAVQENVAVGKLATMSSYYSEVGWSGLASLAVDGNTSTFWRSCVHTAGNNKDWWQVDLGRNYTVSQITIYHREKKEKKSTKISSCASPDGNCNKENVAVGKLATMSSYYSEVGWSGLASLAVDGNKSTFWRSCVHTAGNNKDWWQVDLGRNYTVSQITIYHREKKEKKSTKSSSCVSPDGNCNKENVAVGKLATMSSYYSEVGWSGLASLAVDGNTSTFWRSCVHTAGNNKDWWQVDLGRNYTVSQITIYHREKKNVAVGKLATMSSYYSEVGWSGPASLAVDGNTSTFWRSCVHTAGNNKDWWQVDLGRNYTVSQITIYHREKKNVAVGKLATMSSYYSEVGWSGPASLAVDGNTSTFWRSCVHTAGNNKDWWQVDLGRNYTVSQITIYHREKKNVAVGKLATMSSYYSEVGWSGPASLAVDGNTSTFWRSCVHTAGNNKDWWQVDLGRNYTVSQITIYHREKKNVAVGKLATMSSYYSEVGWSGPASLAVDGNTSTFWRSCVHTAGNNKDWWQVDLGRNYTVSQITIYHREKKNVAVGKLATMSSYYSEVGWSGPASLAVDGNTSTFWRSCVHTAGNNKDWWQVDLGRNYTVSQITIYHREKKNVAVGKLATMSSYYSEVGWSGPASLAVDGNTSTFWRSCVHTAGNNKDWWQVDLGRNYTVSQITIYHREKKNVAVGKLATMSSYYSEVGWSGPASLAVDGNTSTFWRSCVHTAGNNKDWWQVDLGRNYTVSQITIYHREKKEKKSTKSSSCASPDENCNKENVAVGKLATMSSYYSEVGWSGPASLAVDGNTSTFWRSCVHTAGNNKDWWQVDLGRNYTVSQITIYHREKKEKKSTKSSSCASPDGNCNKENVAVGKLATMSSYYSEVGWSGPASLAVDGNTSTFWRSCVHTAGNNKDWWQVDLGRNYTVSQITIYHREKKEKKSTKSSSCASPDGNCNKENVAVGKLATMSSYYSEVGYRSGPASLAVDGNISTFWRSCVHTAGNNKDWWQVDLGRNYTVSQITIYHREKKNVAVGKLATMSSYYSEVGYRSGPASLAVDGNTSTFWRSCVHTAGNNKDWWQVDLGRNYTVSQITIYHREKKNVAVGKLATMSSYYSEVGYRSGPASLAVDGNTSTFWRSCVHTAGNNKDWWQVDLGRNYTVSQITIYHREKKNVAVGKLATMSSYYSEVGYRSGPASLAVDGNTSTFWRSCVHTAGNNKDWWQVDLGRNYTVSQITIYHREKKNVAVGKLATMSSYYSEVGYRSGPASLAVDGNTSTFWRSCVYTAGNNKDWWQVDLGRNYTVSQITIYHREKKNVAVEKLATMSSYYSEVGYRSGPASLAVDGNTSTFWRSCVHTAGNNKDWWQVDLGRNYTVSQITIYHREKKNVAVEKLATMSSYYSEVGYRSGPASLAVDGNTSTFWRSCVHTAGNNKDWWQVDLGRNYTVSQITIYHREKKNVAVGKLATMSSYYSEVGYRSGPASLAVDGNTSTFWRSCVHTAGNNKDWWQVDLGRNYTVSQITIYHREKKNVAVGKLATMSSYYSEVGYRSGPASLAVDGNTSTFWRSCVHTAGNNKDWWQVDLGRNYTVSQITIYHREKKNVAVGKLATMSSYYSEVGYRSGPASLAVDGNTSTFWRSCVHTAGNNKDWWQVDLGRNYTVSQITIYHREKKNVAVGKLATMSSYYSEVGYRSGPASLAVDGNTSTFWRSCVHTAGNNKDWWQVVLGRNYTVSQITIYHREKKNVAVGKLATMSSYYSEVGYRSGPASLAVDGNTSTFWRSCVHTAGNNKDWWQVDLGRNYTVSQITIYHREKKNVAVGKLATMSSYYSEVGYRSGPASLAVDGNTSTFWRSCVHTAGNNKDWWQVDLGRNYTVSQITIYHREKKNVAVGKLATMSSYYSEVGYRSGPASLAVDGNTSTFWRSCVHTAGNNKDWWQVDLGRNYTVSQITIYHREKKNVAVGKLATMSSYYSEVGYRSGPASLAVDGNTSTFWRSCVHTAGNNKDWWQVDLGRNYTVSQITIYHREKKNVAVGKLATMSSYYSEVGYRSGPASLAVDGNTSTFWRSCVHTAGNNKDWWQVDLGRNYTVSQITIYHREKKNVAVGKLATMSSYYSEVGYRSGPASLAVDGNTSTFWRSCVHTAGNNKDWWQVDLGRNYTVSQITIYHREKKNVAVGKLATMSSYYSEVGYRSGPASLAVDGNTSTFWRSCVHTAGNNKDWWQVDLGRNYTVSQITIYHREKKNVAVGKLATMSSYYSEVGYRSGPASLAVDGNTSTFWRSCVHTAGNNKDWWQVDLGRNYTVSQITIYHREKKNVAVGKLATMSSYYSEVGYRSGPASLAVDGNTSTFWRSCVHTAGNNKDWWQVDLGRNYTVSQITIYHREKKNVAVGKLATMSSYYSEVGYRSGPASLAVDGNTSTFWRSCVHTAGNNKDWWQVDLGRNYTVSQITIYHREKKNVAVGKLATMSSYYSEVGYRSGPASLAVDGNTSTFWRSCVHTAGNNKDWWQVDLGRNYTVSQITIYHREKKNVAVGKLATMSSYYSEVGYRSGPASLAVDGNTSTFWRSCVHTAGNNKDWWQVDLGRNYTVSQITIYHREKKNVAVGMLATMSSYYSEVGYRSGPASLAVDGNTSTFWRSCVHTAGNNKDWWQVDLGRNYTVSQITIYHREKKNVAVGKLATMSSYYSEVGYRSGPASLAVDGNTSTFWRSCVHTAGNNKDWWQVDLGRNYTVSQITIYHREKICKPGLYGEKCDKECDSNCRGGQCDNYSGTCEAASPMRDSTTEGSKGGEGPGHAASNALSDQRTSDSQSGSSHYSKGDMGGLAVVMIIIGVLLGAVGLVVYRRFWGRFRSSNNDSMGIPFTQFGPTDSSEI
ncbi:hypothetical protein ACOMHN_013217 [Nucella lapillus]